MQPLLQSSVVCLLVCHDCGRAKTAEQIRDVICWNVASDGPVEWDPDPPLEGAVLRGEGAAHYTI